jgi:hypothetical protein
VDWDRLCAGRSLLFIHGTFSTAHGGFGLIPDGTFASLYDRYGGRVFAFNHFTLSHDPRRNVQWLLTKLPDNRTIEVDIVCHSRGGLVARTLAERPSVFGLDSSRVTVRRIVFVGVPNHGTALADADHMVKMIDRFTSAINLFPSGPLTETLEGLITAVKMIGHGALNGLGGLMSMCPKGDFLRNLNRGSPTGAGYRAIAADYKPTDQGLRALLTGKLADAVIDRVFADTPNDMVVPQPGVFDANGCEAFPIPDASVLKIPSNAGVIHTTMFGYPPVNGKLTEWLI